MSWSIPVSPTMINGNLAKKAQYTVTARLLLYLLTNHMDNQLEDIGEHGQSSQYTNFYITGTKQ